MFDSEENKSGNIYVVPDSRQENSYEVVEMQSSNTFDKKPPKPPKPPKDPKPCPPGHYIGKGHHPGDNCKCDGFEDTTPSVGIDQVIFYVVVFLIGVAMIVTTDKRYQKWIYKIRQKTK